MGAFVQTRARHLRIRAFLLARRLVFPAHEVGPDFADEREALAVRKPLRHRGAGRNAGDAARFAAVDRDDVDLVLGVIAALGDEGDPLAVGAHRGLRVVGLVAGELARRRRPPRGISHRSVSPLFSAMSKVVTGTTAAVPSGVIAGSPSRLSAHIFSAVSRRGVVGRRAGARRERTSERERARTSERCMNSRNWSSDARILPSRIVEASYSRSPRRIGPSSWSRADARIARMKPSEHARYNEFGQPIGFALAGLEAAAVSAARDACRAAIAGSSR